MLIDLSHLGLIQVSGDGAKKLLQGQLTCHLDEVSENQSRLGAHCNPQGRILSFFRLFQSHENYYLQMPLEILPEALAALQKYAIFFKVTLTDVSNQFKQIAISANEFSHDFSEAPLQRDEVVQINGIVIIKITKTEFLLIGEPSRIESLFAEETFTEESINLWKTIQIENGIPTLYANTLGKLLPHEINLHKLNAVSFNKGCYTGQEIIARMHYRGQLKKQMYRGIVKSNSLPLPGNDIYDETGACGIIVDSCDNKNGFYEILAVTNQKDKEEKQLFLDPDRIQNIEFLS